MKRVLITGKNSYVGNSFEKWLENYPDKYKVEKISLRDGLWRELDFSLYDVIYHVAGIAHIKENKDNADDYYRINRDLAYEVAKKAKSEGVKQFIFLSSMSVYGMESGVINCSTPLNPKSNYGKSKLQAEELIEGLEDKSFRIVILRPPMIYGKGCKGNYPRLAKLAIRLPVYPDINNKRSMIYIDNLSELVKQLIDKRGSGLLFPQNSEYVKVSDLVKLIAECHGKNIKLTRLFNPIISFLKVRTLDKVFGDLIYEERLSSYNKKNYSLVNFEDSVRATEE